MDDRTLLELAAKAAGLNVRWHEESIYGATMEIMECEAGGPPWNPLTDDGDALWLAVKLRIDVQHWDGPERISAEHPDLPINSITLEAEGDAMTICRRVIVLAAAEVGRAMK